MSLFRAPFRSLQYLLIVLVLKVFQRQNTVISISSDDVVREYALIAPKRVTLKTIRGLGSSLVAVSASNLVGFAFLDGQHIDHTVEVETGWKIFQITSFRDSAECLTVWAYDCVSAMACSVSSNLGRNCANMVAVLDR